MKDKLLLVDGISKHFRGLQALKDVSFELSEGELLGLIGPNASGKTTLINIINGYYPPDSGSLYLEEEQIGGLTPDRIAKLGITRMFQTTRIYPRLTVMQNMLSVAYAIGRFPIGKARERANRILEQVDLLKMSREPAGNLSGGQRKLLEFGLCFMGNPKLVLLDEPFASIHPELKEILDQMMRTYNKEGVAFILVSHDIPSIIGTCPRLVVLAAGQILADGPTEKVRNRDEVVEAYLGESF